MPLVSRWQQTPGALGIAQSAIVDSFEPTQSAAGQSVQASSREEAMTDAERDTTASESTSASNGIVGCGAGEVAGIGFRPVFVFSTAMANTAADSVRLGAHFSLLEFHASASVLAAALGPRHKWPNRRRASLQALNAAQVWVLMLTDVLTRKRLLSSTL